MNGTELAVAYLCVSVRMPTESLISYAFVKMEFRNKIHDNPTKEEKEFKLYFLFATTKGL